MSIKEDPIVNVIYEGIISPIKSCIENKHERAALQLLYCGIDAMAFLSLEEGKEESSRADFGGWCDKYLRFNVNEKITGLEFFAARSGLVHNYKAESKLSKDGKVRMIGYYSGEGPDIIYAPKESEELVLVRVEGLVLAFSNAVDKFIVDLFSGNRKAAAEERFENMFSTLPLK
jgi:hypothetical protein